MEMVQAAADWRFDRPLLAECRLNGQIVGINSNQSQLYVPVYVERNSSRRLPQLRPERKRFWSVPDPSRMHTLIFPQKAAPKIGMLQQSGIQAPPTSLLAPAYVYVEIETHIAAS
jgi:hypothetical protein